MNRKEPSEIPKLTFSEIKKFYSDNYHPSNSKIGLLFKTNLKSRLEIMDEYLSEFSYKQFDKNLPYTKPFTEVKNLVVDVPNKQAELYPEPRLKIMWA